MPLNRRPRLSWDLLLIKIGIGIIIFLGLLVLLGLHLLSNRLPP